MSALEPTRRSLHGVAELVLAGPQYRASSTIRLRVTPGGFATTTAPDLRVDGVELVRPDGRQPLDGRSCRALAASAGVAVGGPADLYRGGSGVDPDAPTAVDPAATAVLVDCFAAGDEALRRLSPGSVPVLWPEHFDVSITVDEVNYGVSPGDEYLAEPYAYVGPWKLREGPFWNAPFGAARPLRELSDVDSVVAFFESGRAQS
jgi:hypothetical protein